MVNASETWTRVLAQEVRMVDYAVALALEAGEPPLDELYLPSEETALVPIRGELRRILFERPEWGKQIPGLPDEEGQERGPVEVEIELRDLLGSLCKKGHHPFDSWNAVKALITNKVFTAEVHDARVTLKTTLAKVRQFIEAR